jgi:hypothetical protein
MVTRQQFIQWGSASMVFACGAAAGHYASMGMTTIQWAGAVAAVLGSVTLAVAVRVWPEPAKAKGRR